MARRDGVVDRNRAGWRRVGWGILRYAVGYAGALVVAAALVVRNDLALVGVVGLGCFLLLFAAGGEQGTRTVVPGSQADALFQAGSSEREPRPGGAVSRSTKYGLVGAGLVVGGIAALLLT